MWKQWRRWLLVVGSHDNDKLYADALRRAAGRFGAKIVQERVFEDTGGARRTDSGIAQIQRQIPVFTQQAPAYDVLVAADESEVFAAYLPYRTWDARPVAGSAGLTLRPSSRMRLEQTYIYRRLGGPLLFRDAARDTVYVNRLARLKVEYQFTRALSLRGTLDYEAVRPDRSLIQLERSGRLDGNFLLTWLQSPGTALYVGYTDRRWSLQVRFVQAR